MIKPITLFYEIDIIINYHVYYVDNTHLLKLTRVYE